MELVYNDGELQGLEGVLLINNKLFKHYIVLFSLYEFFFSLAKVSYKKVFNETINTKTRHISYFLVRVFEGDI